MAPLPLEPDIWYNEVAHASRWYFYGLMTGLGLWVGFQRGDLSGLSFLLSTLLFDIGFSMTNVAVIGAQWGDEGKGKIVDWLSSRADVVRDKAEALHA